MKTHTLGFIFNQKKDKVLLILKERPRWQKGKLNGIGGKHEKGESSEECISRETKEETNLTIAPQNWQKYAEISMNTSIDVDVFTTIFSGPESKARSNESLQVDWYPVDALPSNVMSNLRWLIPVAVDFLSEEHFIGIQAKYTLEGE